MDKKYSDSELKHLAHRLNASQSFQAFLPASAEHWFDFLQKLDEGQINDFKLILSEEDSMIREVHKEEARKHEVNKTQLLQRLHRITIDKHV